MGYYQLNPNSMPFLTKLLEDDVHKVISPLGYSNAIHGAFLSGCNPQTHGLWTHVYYEPNKKSSFDFLKYFVWDSLLERIHPLLPVAEKVIIRKYLEKRGQTIPLLSPSTHLKKLSIRYTPFVGPNVRFKVPSIFDICRDTRIQFNFVKNSEFGKLKFESSKIPLNPKFRLNYILLSTDEHFHHLGLSHPKTILHLKEIDMFLSGLFERIQRKFSKFTYAIFSDHGLCPVSEKIDFLDFVSKEIDSEDFLIFIDATMARFWFFSDESKKTVEKTLDNVPFGYTLSSMHRKEYGVDFEDNKFGDIIFLFKPGLIPSPDSWGMSISRLPLIAVHGYEPHDSSSYGFLTGNLSISAETIKAIDLVPTLLDVWSIPIPKHIEGKSLLG